MRGVLAGVMLLVLPVIWVGWSAGPAWAGCGGTVTHQAVGGNESSNTRLGDQANVLVNNFSSNQYESWRAVAILKNSSNFAEAGWFTDESVDQGHHPYKTWVTDGVPHEVDFNTVNLSGGANHNFKVHDQNHDHYWSFAYDGNPMGNEFVNMDWGTPITESERRCTTDSLYAHFLNLKTIPCTNCAWQSYQSLSQYINTTSDYKFCKVSNTEYWVKKTC